MIKFKNNNTIKAKKYLLDYVIKVNKHYLIIIIIYNKCIFYINNKIQSI